MTLFERLQRIRMGGAVERCHTVMHHGSYSVAAHSWGVAVLLYALWPEDFPRLAIYCISHDVPEGWVGDVPATVKRWEPGLKYHYDQMEGRVFSWLDLPNDAGLSPEDKDKLSACDKLELYFWACEQLLSGNKFAFCIIESLDAFFVESPLPSPADELYSELRFRSLRSWDVSWSVLRDIRRIPE